MDEMTDFSTEEQEAIKAQVPDNGLSGPLLSRDDYDASVAEGRRMVALEKAIHAFAEADGYDAKKIVDAAERFDAFLAGLTSKEPSNA